MVLSGQQGRQRSKPNPHTFKGPLKPGLGVRLSAQRLLAAVVETATPLDGLTDDNHGHPHYLALEPRDRALTRAILSTALRFRRTIDGFLSGLLDKSLPDNAKSLRHLLHVAAAQILFLDVPDHSAVDLAVEAARIDPRSERFASLVNALLRRMVREKDIRLPQLLQSEKDAADWFIRALQQQYGIAKANNILAMHRIEAPIDFTVKSNPSHWAEQFGGIVMPGGSVRLARLSCPVSELPGYADGEWWVQDMAAALPVRMMGNVSGLNVADLCAAPGGKTALLAANGANVTALDISASRLKRLSGNLERLGLKAQTAVSSLFDWEPETQFDAVLLDAPCSSTGTMRRHPDVAWTKSPQDVAKLADLQFRMLAHAVQFVKPGGRLLFSNCSLLAEEGEALYARACSEIENIKPDPVNPTELPGLEPLIDSNGCLRSTPADVDMGDAAVSGLDGFFAARFTRTG